MCVNKVNAASFEFDHSNMFEPLSKADRSFVIGGRRSGMNIQLKTGDDFTWCYQS